MKVAISYDKSVSKTPAFALIAEAWNELVQAGHTPEHMGTPAFGPSSEVLVACHAEDQDVIGVLVWDHDRDRATFNIRLAYVEPSSRQRGVFTELLVRLIDIATDRGILSIFATVSADDAVGHAVLKAGKLKPVSVEYEYAVS